MKKYLGYLFIAAIPLFIGFIYYKYYAVSGDVWSKQCSFHELTGLECPGCGGQRAFYFLIHGHFLEAFRHNVLLMVLLPFFLYLYFLLAQVYILRNKAYLKYFNFRASVGYIFLIILALFFILRNIPVSPFIYLSPPQ